MTNNKIPMLFPNKAQTSSADKLESITDYLDCSVDYLLGRTDNLEVNR